MEKFLFISLLFLVQQAQAVVDNQDVIYELSKADYSRMPPKNHLDRFIHCLDQPRGVYCTAHADIVSDEPSELLHMMTRYSAHSVKHFNYTNILYGLCLTQNCRPFYNGSEDTAELRSASEACLNHSLSTQYGLKTRVTKLNCYFEQKDKFDPDWVDWSVAVLMLGILAFNIVGTVYDVNRDHSKPGNPVLKAFSLRINWNQMAAPPSSDPKLARLAPIHGIRVITSILVILGHVPLPLMVAIDNPTWIEKAYYVPAYHVLAQGHLITLSFFLISGFLLTYNFQILSEKTKLTWKSLPKAIFSRWLRLTPINVVSLLIAATWIRFSSYGPVWQEVIGQEVHDCRNYGIYNLFYLNNLIDHSECILQSWYLACDVHLHIIGLAVIILAPSPKVRWWIMGSLYMLGILWPAYNIYSMDLDGTLLASPTTMSQFFITDPTFNYIYKRTYSNMPLFIIGMAFGFLVYDWQKSGVFEKDFTKYRFLYWLLFPMLLVLVSSAGFLFCGDEPRASMALRLAFSPIVKPLFVILVMLVILGAMLKVENFERSIIEWSGWVPLSRISYCIYAFHVGVIRYLGGTRTTLVHFSVFHLMQDYAGVTFITMQVALVFYLFVEAPFGHLIKMAIGSSAPHKRIQNGTANGIKSNGALANGTAANGQAVNGVKSNGALANGTAANGHAINGIKSNGVVANGVANGSAVRPLNGTASNGSALDGTAANGHAYTYQETAGVKDKDA